MPEQHPAVTKQAAIVVATVLVLASVAFLVLRPQGSRIPGESPAGAAVAPAGAVAGGPTPSALPSEIPVLALPPTVPTPGIPLASAEALAAALMRTTDITVATANLYVRLPWEKARADLDRLATRAGLIGLNEISPERAAQIRGWVAANPGWVFVRPTYAGNRWSGSNAVLVRTEQYDVLDNGVVFGSRASMPGYRVDSRWITWVQLVERTTARPLVYLQTHMDAAVETRGYPRQRAGARLSNNEQYMATLRAMAASFARTHEVVVGGDWNVDANADRRVRSARLPFQRLEDAGAVDRDGLRSSYTLLGFGVPPTSNHAGNRYIDYLALWIRTAGSSATMVRHEVLTGAHSDHNPLLATIRLTPRLGLG